MSAVLTATESDLAAADQREHEADPVESLQRRIERVAAVAGQIETIARQANLLALNSTIEAARAGGINKESASVVADVKALAGRTSAVSDEISQVTASLIDDFERLAAEREAGVAEAEPQKSSAPILSIVPTPEPDPEPEHTPLVSEAQKALVQETFARLKPAAEQAAHLFYARLFQIAPQVRATFPDDMTDQRRQLLATLEGAVAGLDHLEKLAPQDQETVGPHDAAVGAALLWTLDKALGEEFTAEVEDAWVAVYGVLSKVMKLAS